MKNVMNRRNVRIGAVVCSAGVVIGGITLATSALGAPTALALSNGATAFTIANLGHANADTANAGYALKLTDAGSATTNKFILTAAPSGGTLSLTRTTANAAAGTTSTADLTTGSPVSATLNTVADTDLIYVTANVPGTYKLQAFQDTNGSNTIDADSERASAEISVTVYDAINNTTTEAGDDVAPVFTAPSPSDIGVPVKAVISYSKPLSVTDARGTGATGLKARLAALTAVDVTGPTGVTAATDVAATYTPSTGDTTYTTAAPTAAGTVNFRGDLKPTLATTDGTGASQYGAKAVQVQSNGVADLLTEVTKDANHLSDGTTRPGTATTTIVATADSDAGAGFTAAANKTVYFKLTGTGLSVGGTAVPSGGTVSGVTDTTGKASITVTSATTTAGTSYTVQASSNNHSDSETVAYTAVAGTVTIDPALSAKVGGSVTVTGTLEDQFGQAYTPNGVQAVLQVDRNASSFATVDESTTVNISGGKFSATVADTSSSNTTSRRDFYRFTFTNGFTATSTPTTGSIDWVASVDPATVSIDSLTNTTGTPTTTFPVTGNTTFDLVDAGSAITAAGNTEQIVSTVKNSAGEVVRGADFTITGSGGGVYFLDKNGKAVSSFSGKTDANGHISDGTNAYVRVAFTMTGAKTITVASGGKTAATGTLNVEDASVPYTVELAPTVGLTNKNVLIKGKVLDAFGNGVAGVQAGTGAGRLSLTLSTNTVGNVISGPTTTDSAGNFTAILVSGDSVGSANVTATVVGLADTASAAYGQSGLTLPAGVGKDTAALRIIADGVTVQAVERRIGPGPVELNGVALPGSPVDVYTRPLAGGTYEKVASTTADEEGAWSKIIQISSAVSIKAAVDTKESTPISVAMNSKLQANAVALGDGKVKVSIAGYPGVKDSGILLQEAQNGKLVTVGTLRSDSRGVGKITWTTTPGTHTLKAVYKAPGTNQGSVVISFTVN